MQFFKALKVLEKGGFSKWLWKGFAFGLVFLKNPKIGMI